MDQETVVYAVNLIIGAILAVLLTQHWRLAGRESNLGHWMVAAWVMTAADLLFALRPSLPYWIGRFFPTLLVTVGQVVLLLWTMRVAGKQWGPKLGIAIVAVHAAALGGFLMIGGSSWRTVFNGVLWGALAIGAYVFLRRAPKAMRGTLAVPAFVFLAHGLFHVMRLSLATVVTVQQQDAGSTPWIQVIGDVEVSFFMVALFVSLLVAHLHLRNEELRIALGDVKLLSGLLPLCAWCRKVRSDDGYWTQLEEYFTSRRGVTFTHGICDSCNAKHLGVEPGT